MTAHKFLMGLRSGELLGQSIKVNFDFVKSVRIFFFEVWHGALSC